jgi:hypothetical protein
VVCRGRTVLHVRHRCRTATPRGTIRRKDPALYGLSQRTHCSATARHRKATVCRYRFRVPALAPPHHLAKPHTPRPALLMGLELCTLTGPYQPDKKRTWYGTGIVRWIQRAPLWGCGARQKRVIAGCFFGMQYAFVTCRPVYVRN